MTCVIAAFARTKHDQFFHATHQSRIPNLFFFYHFRFRSGGAFFLGEKCVLLIGLILKLEYLIANIVPKQDKWKRNLVSISYNNISLDILLTCLCLFSLTAGHKEANF